MKLPDYETILFYNYFNRPDSFKINLDLFKNKMDKKYGIDDNIFLSECLREVKRKSMKMEEQRVSLIEKAQKAIENWKRQTNNFPSANDAIRHWELNILELKNENYGFGFTIHLNNGGGMYKNYSLSKLDLIKIENIVKSVFNDPPKEELINDNLEEIDIEDHKVSYNEVFRSNYFELFQILFEEFKITKPKRADLKFIFEMMKSDGFIKPHVTQNKFLYYLYEIYGIYFEPTSNWTKKAWRLEIYESAKENFKKINKAKTQ